MPIQTQNPFTEKIEKKYKPISDKDAFKRISDSSEAQKSWSKLSIKERGRCLKKVANNLLKNKEKYGKVITREMGKPLKQSISEIEKCALNCVFYAENTEKFLKEEIYDTEFRHASVSFEPIGLVFAVMPWNFPFWQVFRFSASALMAGNGVVLKHASNVPKCSLLIEKIFTDSGLPKNLFSSLLIESSQVEKVIMNKNINAITLTGSEQAGSKVASIAGREIKKTVLELGGSDPFIILSDADFEKAVHSAVDSRIPNGGQVCVAGKRFIIEEKIAKKAIELIVERTKKIVIGDPMDLKTEMGPLAKKDIREEVYSQVIDSIKKGAKCLIGGKIPEREGYFFEPTVLIDVKKGMPAYDEEIFGPVMSIIVAKNDKDIIRIANDHDYGLGGAVWSKNEKRAFKIARSLNVGIVAINSVARSDPRFPFGGTKKSGYGRELGEHGIREFVNIKTILAK